MALTDMTITPGEQTFPTVDLTGDQDRGALANVPPGGGPGQGGQQPSGALSQAQADPFKTAEQRLADLTKEVSPLDALRKLGASLIPDASVFAEQRKERRAELQKLFDSYLQTGSTPIHDPLQRMLIGMAHAPSGTPVAGVLGAGAEGAEDARDQNRAMAAARLSAAQKAKFEGLNQIADDTRSDAQLGVNIMGATGALIKPKQYSQLVNEVLERRNQIFDKLVKLGVDASTPQSMAAIEARIDREVAPMVKALYEEYPQYRDLIKASMPKMFASYSSPSGAGPTPSVPQPGHVQPPATGAPTGRPTLGPTALSPPAETQPLPPLGQPQPPLGAATPPLPPGAPAALGPNGRPGLSPNPQPPVTATTANDFGSFIEPPRPTPQFDGILMRDKSAEAARVANAKTAAKYYDETVRAGADAATTTINAAQQLRAIGPDTGKLAPLTKELGGWLEALGVPDSASIVRQSIKSNNAGMLLQQMANAILLQAKGVQTEGDAQRAFAQAAQITDPKAAWEYKLRAMEAAAWRLRYRQQLYQEFAKGRGGNYDGAEAAFSKFEQDVPFVKTLPTRAGPKAPVFFNEFVRNREAAGTPKTQAFKEWGEL